MIKSRRTRQKSGANPVKITAKPGNAGDVVEKPEKVTAELTTATKHSNRL